MIVTVDYSSYSTIWI